MRGADRPRRVAVLCSGLDHVTRGYETFSSELVDELGAMADVVPLLVKGSGPSSSNAVRATALRRDRPVASRLSRALGARTTPDTADRASLSWKGLARAAARRRLRVSPYEVEQLSFACSAAVALRRFRPDVVIASDVLATRALAGFRRRFGGSWSIVFSNGAPWPPPYPFADLVQHLTGPALDLAIEAGEPEARQVLLPYGFDLGTPPPRLASADRRSRRAALGIPSEGAIVLSIGALNLHHKRHHHLVSAVRAVSRSQAVHLVMAGAEEAETSALRRRATEELGVDGFTMTTVAPQEVARLYEIADEFALASTEEGLSRAYVEAAAAGVPMIVHDFPASRWILEDGARYVDMRSVPALAQELTAVLGDVEAPGARRSRQRRVRDRFDWRVVGPGYRELIEHAITVRVGSPLAAGA